MKTKLFLGISFVFLGIFLYSTRLLQVSEDFFYFLIISIVFFGIYFFRGGKEKSSNIGFLIPASICFMLALSTMGISILSNFSMFRVGDLEDIIIPFAIGTAFFLIYLFHTSHYNSKWPLYPMAGLYFATLMSSIEVFPVENFIPIILIIAGLFLIIISLTNKRSNKQQSSQEKEEVIDLRQNNTN